jgi:hypothetical protein
LSFDDGRTLMSTVFELLEREWRGLAADEGAARELGAVCDAAGGAATLGQVETYVRAAGPRDADRVLAALVARAVDGHALAARVLLQLLLPGARRLARRWWALGDRDERAAAAIAAVYDRIRRYPLERRPARVAANVLMDAELDLRRAARAAGRCAGLPSEHREPPAEHPALELVEVLVDAVADGVISTDDAELIAASRIAGVRLADLAVRRRRHVRTLQYQRRRAERALVATAAA